MRRLAAGILLTLAFAACGGGDDGEPAPRDAGLPDPCGLVTADEVRAALGANVAEGAPFTVPAREGRRPDRSCAWRREGIDPQSPEGIPVDEGITAEVTVFSGAMADYDVFLRAYAQYATAVEGLAEEAFAADLPTEDAEVLFVFDRGVTFSVKTKKAPRGATKELAEQAVDRL